MSNPDDPKIGDGGGVFYQPIFEDDSVGYEAPPPDVADTSAVADPDMYTDVPAAPLLQMAGTGGAQGKGGASAINQPQTDPLLKRLAEFHNVSLADIKTLARLYVYIFDKTAPVLVAEGRIPTLRDLFRLIDLTLVLSVKHDFLNLFEAIKLVLLNQFTKPEVREQIFKAVEEVREKVSGVEQGETPKEKLKRKLRYWMEDGLLTSPEDMLHKVAEDVGLPLRAYLPFLRGHPRSDDSSASYQFMLNLWRNMSDGSRARHLLPMIDFKREYRRLLRGDEGAEESCFKLITTRPITDEVREKIVAYFVGKDRADFLARVIESADTAKHVSEKVADLYVLKDLGENHEVLSRLKPLFMTHADELFDNYDLLADVDPDFKRRLEEYSWSDIQEAISELMAEQVAASDTQKIAATQRIVFSLIQVDAFKSTAGRDAHGNPLTEEIQDILTGLVPKEEALFLVGPTLQALQILAAAIARKHPVYLEGETGTGKNAMLRYLANLAGVSLFRLNFGQETDNEQLYGHYEIQKVNGKRRVVLTDGKMIQAIKYGGWVLWDEANLARPGFLVAQNDVVQQLATGWVWVRQGGELKKIKVHDNFRLFATGNPEGYADRQSIEKSFGDRWVRVKIREFGKKDTQTILAKLHPDLSERTIADIVDLLFAVKLVLGRRGAITLRTAKRVAERVSQPPLKVRGGEGGSYVIRAIEAEVLDGLNAREKAEAIAILNVAEIFPLPRGEGEGGGWTPSDSQLDNTLTGVTWGIVDLLGDHDLRQRFDAMIASYRLQIANAPQRGSYAVGQIIPVPTTLHYAIKVLDSLLRGDFLLLEGPPAISKSAIPRWIAELTGREIIEVTGSHDTTVADLIGMPALDADGNLVFEDGYFTEAIKRDCILLINEANLIKASVMERLNSLFDDDRDIFIIENGVKKPLKLGPNFRLILTQNPEDMRGGRIRLSPALENKLRKIVFDRNFHPLELQAIITALVPSLKDYASVMVDVFTTVGTILKTKNISLTLRDLKRWISLTEALAGTTLYDLPHALKAAAQLVFFSRFAEMADQPFVETIAPYTQALLSKDATPLQAQHVRDLVATLTPTLPLPPSPQGRENKMATTLPSPSRGEGQGEGVNAEKLSFIEPTMQALVGLVAGIHANVPVYLEGETGTGKNAMLRYLAYAAGVALLRLNFGLETDNEQLFGGYEIRRVDGRRRVVLTDGKMIEALEHGAWVVWDEVNLARSGFLVSLNDFVQQLESGWVWVRHGGKLRRVQVHKNFRLFATGNPEGYADRQSIEKSFGDRWLKLYVQEFDAQHLQALLADSYPALDSPTVFHIVDMLMALKLVIGRRGVVTVRTAKRVAERVQELDQSSQGGSYLIRAIEAEVLDGLNAREKAEAISALNEKLAEVESMLTDSLVDDILAQVAKGEVALLGDHELRAKFDAMIAQYRSMVDEDNSPQPPLSLRGGEMGPQIISVPTTLHYAIKVLDSLLRRDFVLLEGPPAISKSAIPQWIGQLTGQKVLEVTGTKDMDVSDLLGMPTLDENGDLKFQDGFFLEAIKHGYLLVINEANLIRAGVLERLNSVFDEDRMIYVLENGVKQPIAIHKNFRLILTQNPADMRGGRAQLSPALENKLRKIVFNRNFHPLELRALVQEMYPELAIVSEEIVHAYTKAQDALTKEGEPITLRNLLQWLEMSTLLGAESTLTPDQALILGGEIVFKARNVATREKIAMLFYRLEEQVGGKLREQARGRKQEAAAVIASPPAAGEAIPLVHSEDPTQDQIVVLRRQIADVLLEDESGNVRMLYEHLVARRGWHNLGVWFYAILPHIKQEEALALMQSLKVSRMVFYGHLLTLPHTPAWVVDFVLGSRVELNNCVMSMATGRTKVFPEAIKNDPRYAQLLCELLNDDRVNEMMVQAILMFLMGDAPASAYDYLRNLYAKNYGGAQSAKEKKITETSLRLLSWLPHHQALELLQIFYRCNRSQKNFPCEQSFMIELGRLPLDLKKDLLFEVIAGEVTPAPKLLESGTASDAQYTLAEWALLELSGEGEAPLLTKVKKFSGHPCIRSWVLDLALARLGDGGALASIQSKFTAYFSQFQSSRKSITELRVGKIPDLSAYEAVQMAETLARNNHQPAWEFLEEVLRDPLQIHPKQSKIKSVVQIHIAVLEALSRLGGERADGLITWFFETYDLNFAESRKDEVYLTLAAEGSFDKIPLSLQPQHEIPLLVRVIDNQKLQRAIGAKPCALFRLKKLNPELAEQKARQAVENKQESANVRVWAYKLLSAAVQKELIHLVYEEAQMDGALAAWSEVLVAVEGQAALPTLRALWEKLDESMTSYVMLLARLLMQLDPTFAGAEAKLSRHYGSLIAEELHKSHGMAEGERAERTAALLEELDTWNAPPQDPVGAAISRKASGQDAPPTSEAEVDGAKVVGEDVQLAVLRRQIADVLLEDEGGDERMVYEHLVARRGWHNLPVWFYAILPHLTQKEALSLMQSLKMSPRAFYGHLLSLRQPLSWVVDFILSNRVELNYYVMSLVPGIPWVYSEAIRNDPRYAQLLCEMLTDDRVNKRMPNEIMRFLLRDAPAAAHNYLCNLYAKNCSAQSAREKEITRSSIDLLFWLPHNLALELLQIFYRENRSSRRFPYVLYFVEELGNLPFDLKKDFLFEIILGEMTSAPNLLRSVSAIDAQYTLAEWALLELTAEEDSPLLTVVKGFSGHPCIRSWVLDLALARLGDGEALASIQSKFTAYFSQFQLSRIPFTELQAGKIPDLSAYEAVAMAETLARNNHEPAWEFLEELLRAPLQIHPKQSKIKSANHIRTAVLEALSRMGGERAGGLITLFFETHVLNFYRFEAEKFYGSLVDESSIDRIPLALKPQHEIPLLVRVIDNRKFRHDDIKTSGTLLRLKKLDPGLAEQKAREIVENKQESAYLRVDAYKLLSAAVQKELIHLVYEEAKMDGALAAWSEVLVAVEGPAALPTLRALWEKLDESMTSYVMLLARLLMSLDPIFASDEAKLSRHFGSLIQKALQKSHGAAEGDRAARADELLAELDTWNAPPQDPVGAAISRKASGQDAPPTSEAEVDGALVGRIVDILVTRDIQSVNDIYKALAADAELPFEVWMGRYLQQAPRAVAASFSRTIAEVMGSAVSWVFWHKLNTKHNLTDSLLRHLTDEELGVFFLTEPTAIEGCQDETVKLRMEIRHAEASATYANILETLRSRVDLKDTVKFFLISERGSTYYPELLKEFKQIDGVADVIKEIYDAEQLPQSAYVWALHYLYDLGAVATVIPLLHAILRDSRKSFDSKQHAAFLLSLADPDWDREIRESYESTERAIHAALNIQHQQAHSDHRERVARLLGELDGWAVEEAGGKKQETRGKKQEVEVGDDQLAGLRRQIADKLAGGESLDMRTVYEHLLARRGFFNLEQWFGTVAPHLTREECEELQTKLAIPQDNYLESLLTLPHLPQWVVDYLLSDVDLLQRCIDLKTSGKGGGGNLIPAAIRQDVRCGRLLEELLSLDDMRWGATGMSLYYFLQDFPDRAYDFLHAMYSKKDAGGSENERGIVKLSLGVLDRLSPERALTLLQSYYHNRGPSALLLPVSQPMERFRRQLGLIPHSLKRDFLVEIVGGYEGHWDPEKFSDGYTLAEWAVMELAASSDAGLLESMRLWEGHLRIRPPILHLAMAQLGDATGMQLTQAHFDSKPELPWNTGSLMAETLARHGYEPAWEFLENTLAPPVWATDPPTTKDIGAQNKKYATTLGILSRLGGARGGALLAAFMKREGINIDFNQEGSLVFSLVFDPDIKGVALQLQPHHEISLLVALIENPTHRSEPAIIPSALARLDLLDANLCEQKARKVFEFGNLLADDRSKVFKYLSEVAKKELIHIVYAELAANRNVASWIDVLVTEEGVKAIPTLRALWEKVDADQSSLAEKLARHLAALDPEWGRREAEMSRHYARLITEELGKSHGEVAGERAERTTELLGELEGWEGEQEAGEEAAAVIARNVSDEAISLAVSARKKIARMLVEQNFMSLSEIYAAVGEAFGVDVVASLEKIILELINLPYTDLIAMAGERVHARLQGLRGHNLQDAYGKPLSYEKIQWMMSLVPPPEKLSMIGPTTQALEWLFGAIKANFPIYLEGETGIGKNAILRFLAHKTATPLMRINFGYETDNEQLYGGYAIERVDGKRRVVLTDGKMIQALQYGAWVVWDEVNLARAGFLVAQNDIVQQIRSGSVWVRRGGRVEQIPVHAHFRLFATGNPQGYAGRQAIEKSFGNRWIKLILSPFKKEEIRLIMAESYPRIPEQTLNFVVNTLHELRRAIGGNFEISIRTYKRVSSRVEEALQMIGAHDLWDQGADGLPVLTAKGMGLFLQAIEAEVLDGLDVQTHQVALNTLRVALPRGERGVLDFVSEKFLDDIFAAVDRGEASLLGDHALRAKFDVMVAQYRLRVDNAPRGSYDLGQIVPVPTTLHYATKVLDAFLHNQFIILEGPPSVSKTEIPKWLGNLVGQEVIEVTGTKEKSVADLLGMPTLDEDGNIVFKEGYLLKALQTGAILILNEANLLQAAVLERLNSLFDDDREILVVEGNHKVPVKIHENFRLVLTQNPADMRGGRNQFSPALVNKLRRIYFRRSFTTLELEAIAEARIRGIFGDTYDGPGGISVPSTGGGQQSTADHQQPTGEETRPLVTSINLPHLTSPYKGEETPPLLGKEGSGEVGRVFQTVFGPKKQDGVPAADQPPRISEAEIAKIEKQMRLEAQEFMREHGHHLRAMSALAALRHVEIKVDQTGQVDIAAMDLDKGVMYINPATAKNLTPHQLLAVALHEGGHGAISRLDREQFFFKDELRHFLANCLEDPRVNEYILSRLPGARADFKSLYGEHFPDPQLIAAADRRAEIRPLGGLPHEQFALAFIDLWANGHLTDRVVQQQIRTDLASLEPIARQIWAAFPTEDPPRRRTVVAKQEYAYDLIKDNIYPVYLKYVEESKKMLVDALQQMKAAGNTPSHIPGGAGRGFPIDWDDLDESARRILEGRAEEQAGWFEPSETSGNRARQVADANRKGEGERQKGKAGEGRYKKEDFGDFQQKTLGDILQDRARDQVARQEFYDGHPWRKYFDPVRNVAEEVAEALRQLLHLNDDFIWDDYFHTSGPKLSIKRAIQMILRDEFGILTAEDLKIFLRKNFPTRRSHRFVLVLDESGSMKGGAQDPAMQAMAIFEYVMQELAMQYAVVGFDNVADVHKDFSEDFADEKEKDNHMYIMETSGGGGTNDYAGIKLAHEMLGEGRQLVIGLGIGMGTEAVEEVYEHHYQSDSFAGLPAELTRILIKYLLSPDAPEDIILVVTDGAGVEETKDLVAEIEGREGVVRPTKKTTAFVRSKSDLVTSNSTIHAEAGLVQAENNLVAGGEVLVGEAQPPLKVRGGEGGSYDAEDVAAAPVADDNPVADSSINAPFLEPHVSILGSQSGVFRSTARVMKAFVR